MYMEACYIGALQDEQSIQNFREILQVKQENVVILGSDLDFERLSPEHLVSLHVVPEDWDCWRFERFADATRIEYEMLTFRMIEGQLWINDFPNCSLRRHFNTFYEIMDRKLTLRATGRFALLNVGDVTSLGQRKDYSLYVTRSCKEGGPSHSEIFGHFTDEQQVRADLAALVRQTNQIWPALP